MASGKKTAGKGSKGASKTKVVKKAAPKKPAPKAVPKKPAPAAKPAAPKVDKAAAAKAKELADKAKAAERAAQMHEKEVQRQAREVDQQRAQLQKERDRLAAEAKKLADERAALKQAEQDRKAAEKAAEAERKAAEKKAEQDRKAAEKAEAARLKAEAKAAEQAAKAAGKKRPIPTTSIAATPIIRPLGEASAPLAPPPPPAKPGHVDHQVLSAIAYGMFAAVNKSFGFAGQSVVKNAALRMLEYGYKRGWLPPKSKEPVRALNEFFGRLETMGYAEKIHIAKRGDNYVLEVSGLADFDAVHSLRELHYPLLPIFLGAMLEAIVDQYFQLKVTMEPIEFAEQKRGFNLGFSIHERVSAAPEVSRLPALNRLDDFED